MSKRQVGGHIFDFWRFVYIIAFSLFYADYMYVVGSTFYVASASKTFNFKIWSWFCTYFFFFLICASKPRFFATFSLKIFNFNNRSNVNLASILKILKYWTNFYAIVLYPFCWFVLLKSCFVLFLFSKCFATKYQFGRHTFQF